MRISLFFHSKDKHDESKHEIIDSPVSELISFIKFYVFIWTNFPGQLYANSSLSLNFNNRLTENYLIVLFSINWWYHLECDALIASLDQQCATLIAVFMLSCYKTDVCECLFFGGLFKHWHSWSAKPAAGVASKQCDSLWLRQNNFFVQIYFSQHFMKGA